MTSKSGKKRTGMPEGIWQPGKEWNDREANIRFTSVLQFPSMLYEENDTREDTVFNPGYEPAVKKLQSQLLKFHSLDKLHLAARILSYDPMPALMAHTKHQELR